MTLGDTAHPGGLTMAGNLLMANTKNIQWKDAAAVVRNVLQMDASNNVLLQDPVGANNLIKFLINAIVMAQVDQNGLTIDGTINSAAAQVSANGQVSGTVSLIPIFNDIFNFKMYIVLFHSFNNFGGTAKSLAVPQSAGAANVLFFMGGFNGSTTGETIQLLSGTVAQSVFIITALATGGGTVGASQTTINPVSFGFGNSISVDHISCNSTANAAVNGMFWMIGI